jgi:AcrR family transcriptional regulator
VKKIVAHDTERRRAILEAARWCFLNFGYAKTTFDDIARRASISRPLIYRKFKNKEELFAGVFDDGFAERFPKAEAAMASKGSKRDRLFRTMEALILEPWTEMVSAPMASEFYETCVRLFPQVEAKHEKLILKLLQQVLETRENAELFMLAVDGLEGDLPTTPILRRRMQMLIERFVS